jgi:uncharacterized protein
MQSKKPGIYVHEISTLRLSVAGVETAIPAFVGYTGKAEKVGDGASLHMQPVRITSFREFREMYGGPKPERFSFTITDTYNVRGELSNRQFSSKMSPDSPSPYKLFYSLQLYFSNGGGPCYVVSVGNYKDDIVTGSTENGTGLLGGVRALENIKEPTLLLFPDAVSLENVQDYGTVVKEALAQCKRNNNRFTIIDKYDKLTNLSQFRQAIGNSHLEFGAAYFPFLRTTFTYEVEKKSKDIRHEVKGQAPDHAVDYSDVRDMAELEEKHPQIFRSLLATTRREYVVLPPSGAMAGIYVKVDRNRGVWKAPANIMISAVLEPITPITGVMQAHLNVDAVEGKSINAIRSFHGRGTLVWGARTLAGNDNEWRYISVRRLAMYIQESVRNATSFVIKEPNNNRVWLRVRIMIEQFLAELWHAGALAGNTQSEAFFVKIGLGESMSTQDIDQGRMIIEIGIAAMRPSEFIMLRITHNINKG